MSFTIIPKVGDSPDDLDKRGVTHQPNVPTIGATALKKEFDAPAKECVAPAVNRLIGELEATTAAQSLGATAPTGRTGTTVQGVLNSISSDLAAAEGLAHSHTNKSVLDKFSDDGTGIKYDGASIEGAVKSVNSKTGDVTLTATDVGALPDSTTIPTKTSDLTNDSNFVDSTALSNGLDGKVDKVAGKGLSTNDYDNTAKAIVDGATAAIAAKSTVAYSQTYTQAGQKVGEITIDGVKTDIITPTGGGGGGGGAVDSVNGQTGTVVLDAADVGALPDNTSIPSKVSDLTNDSGFQTAADVSSAVSTAIGALDVSDSAVSGQYVSAVSETDGKISVTRASLPTVPTTLAGLTGDVNIASPSNDQVLKYDGTSSKWVNGAAPAGGHTMLPTPAAGVNEASVVSAINAGITEGGTNDDVASLFGIGKWSNTMTKTYVVTGTGESGVGTWPADVDNPTVAEKATWITIPSLIGCGSNGNIDVSLKFDPATTSTPITLGGYVIDDSDGTMCIKFGNSISSADAATAKVAVEITIKRTETVAVS